MQVARIIRPLTVALAAVGAVAMLSPARAQQPGANVHILLFDGQSNMQAYGPKMGLYLPSTGTVETWAQIPVYQYTNPTPLNGRLNHPIASSDTGFMYPRPVSAGQVLFNYNGALGGVPNSWGILDDDTMSHGYFGPELSVVYQIQNLYPTETFAVLKLAVGGTSVETDWNPAVKTSLFGVLKTQLQQAEARLTAAGCTYDFWGLWWMQGENGASGVYNYLHDVETFRTVTESLFAAVRNLTDPNLPIVTGRIGNQMLADNIITPQVIPNSIFTRDNLIAATNWRRAQQVQVATETANCAWTDTDNLPVLRTGNSAFWYHFRGSGYLAMGERFFTSWYQLTGRGGAPTVVDPTPARWLAPP